MLSASRIWHNLLCVCWLCFSLFLHQGHNGHHERIDFLTSKEKVSSKRKTGILIGVLVGLLIILAIAAFLIWLFVCEYSWKLSSTISSRIKTWSIECMLWHVWVNDRMSFSRHKSMLFLTELNEISWVFTFPTSVTAKTGITSETVKWIIFTCC